MQNTMGLAKAPWYRSLRFRIFLLIIWLGLGTILILTLYFLDHERHALERELEKRGLQVARTLAIQVVEPLIYEDRFALYDLSRSYLREGLNEREKGPLVQYLAIADRTGQILVDLGWTGSGSLSMGVSPKGTAPPGEVEAIRRLDGLIVEISVPIRARDYRIGTARLGVSRRGVEATLADLRLKVILFVGIIVLGGILIGLWLAHRIIAPVRDLTRTTARLAAGHWGEEVQVNSQDEIGQLARTLNFMSRRLRASIDEIKRTQDSLLRAEKLSALGTLSAGLAHEIKNPLTSIKMILQAMAQDGNDPQIVAEDLRVMLREVDHMNQVLSRFLEFARPAPLRPRRHAIQEVVEEAIGLMGPACSQGRIRVHREVDRDISPLWIAPDKVKQALVNLVLNAVQAMPQGGDLWIRARKADGEGSGVIVEVEDTGAGVPADLVPYVFDPFVTSKEGGTGLGLSVVHSIATEHGGHVELISDRGRGALFRMTLPAGRDHGDHSGGR